MNPKRLGIAVVGTLACLLAQAAPATVYSTAAFTEVAAGNFRLDGLERSTPGSGKSYDVWNIGVTGLAPGSYRFDSFVMEALDGLAFSTLTFNSIDDAGVRQTYVFERNATGSLALLSGGFTVRGNCPIASCVWIDIVSVQPGPGGYVGTAVGTPGPAQGGSPTPTVYDTAAFTEVAVGNYELAGLGRSTTPAAAGSVESVDIWNIDVSGVAPGTYSLLSLVDALDGLTFSSLSFNSIDEAGARHTYLFDQNAPGTHALVSGSLHVRSNCPIASCVWIDIVSAQRGRGGYEGTAYATQEVAVPEPASAALAMLGLAAVLGLARRKSSRAT